MSRVAAYFRERFPLTVFGPLCLLLTGGAYWSAAGTSTRSLVTLSLGVALVVQFRLWDDLEDRARDRTAYPDRVLVNAPEGPFRALLLALAVAAIVLSARRLEAIAAAVALDLAFWGAYRLARPRLSTNGWRYGALLLKYPCFVGVMALSIGDVVPGRLAAAAATAYVCASGYELLHDGRAHVGGAW